MLLRQQEGELEGEEIGEEIERGGGSPVSSSYPFCRGKWKRYIDIYLYIFEMYGYYKSILALLIPKFKSSSLSFLTSSIDRLNQICPVCPWR
jgi:hypothetical protein